jgi:uncharacterized protein
MKKVTAGNSPSLTSMPYLTVKKDGSVLLNLHVQPGASRTRFTGLYGDSLKLAVSAPPVEGKANKEVIAFLAGFFKIAKKEITIVGGLQSREKRCRINSLSEEEARDRFAGLSEEKQGSTGGGT